MRATERFSRGTRVAVAASAVAVFAAGCGGGSDFQNKPRPAVPVQLTGVITRDKVTVSPDSVGAGPVIIVVSNQTPEKHTLTLDGGGGTQQVRVGPIAPTETGRITGDLAPGSYQVKAGTEQAQVREIAPATLHIGKARKSSSDTLLLP
ncbi:MAG TPA: hypothetical protein VF752_07445 [Thermoleophilaceae bacterium]